MSCPHCNKPISQEKLEKMLKNLPDRGMAKAKATRVMGCCKETVEISCDFGRYFIGKIGEEPKFLAAN